MRAFKISVLLILFSMFQVMVCHETPAFWWKSKSEKETAEKNAEQQNTQESKSSSRAGSFWRSSNTENEKVRQRNENSAEKPDPDRFLSKEEREQKEFEKKTEEIIKITKRT